MLDINCTNNCNYQLDGKCTLNEVPNFVQSTYSYDCDCPYFKNKE